jgi:magnesium chelatase subunit I
LETSKAITEQEARVTEHQKDIVRFKDLVGDLIERVVMEARESEYVDEKSGVSARLAISARELVYSAVERRILMNGEKRSIVRISDLYSMVPAMTGKMEMVYEGEQEGPRNVAYLLIGRAIRAEFANYFPAFDKKVVADGRHQPSEYDDILDWFESGNKVATLFNLTDKAYARELNQVNGLAALVKEHIKGLKGDEVYLWMEFVLHGLAEYSKLGKRFLQAGPEFSDLLGSVFSEND